MSKYADMREPGPKPYRKNTDNDIWDEDELEE